MTIRTILVPIADEQPGRIALIAGIKLARQFAAHVNAFHVRFDPSSPIPYVAGPMPAEMLVQISENMEKVAAALSIRLKAIFDEVCQQTEVQLAEHAGRGATPSAMWSEAVGSIDFRYGIEGRVNDLAVVARPTGRPEDNSRDILEGLLFHSGRPVLMVPHMPEVIGETVVVAWNGRVEAARALAAATPFLEAAKKVIIATVGNDLSDGPSGDAVARNLAWHGIAAEVMQTVEEGVSDGVTLLRTAASLNADLLVMGAYSHSRFRELILGGVTRDVIKGAMIPVLLVH